MIIPIKYSFLFGSFVLLAIWIVLFIYRKDLRKEMMVMSFIIGILSVVTGYYWWTIDWWRPLTITNTKVGIEDFLLGFGSGGIMSIIYEEIFKKRYFKRKINRHYPSALTILLLLAFATSFLIWGFKLTSFYASSIAMIITSAFMLYYRKDLLINGLLSGVCMILASLAFYYPIMLFSPKWIETTYILII